MYTTREVFFKCFRSQNDCAYKCSINETCFAFKVTKEVKCTMGNLDNLKLAAAYNLPNETVNVFLKSQSGSGL